MENNIIMDVSNNISFKKDKINNDKINNDKINKNLEKAEQDHIDMNIGKYDKDIYCYNKSESLPSSGWFQKCFLCNKITSSTLFFKKTENLYMKRNYYFYICTGCKNDIDKSEIFYERYSIQCNRYIRKKHTFY